MIVLENITKDFIGFSSAWDRILSGLSFGYLGGKVRFRALEKISFECKSSEIVGIIGRNGAGKSTLLKLISQVSRFDSGKLQVDGKVRAILELGVGFNPELSGEENVYYNGLVWGFSVAEIGRVMDSVFEFAGLQDFRSTPLKNYSSGMIMRLGFALATATPPEVLIVDEALAVGDAAFQQKCLKRFHDFQDQGTTTLIVSHDLTLLSQICTRIIVMDFGKLIYDGDPISAVQEYMKTIATQSGTGGNFQPDEFIEDLQFSLSKKGETSPSLAFVGEEILLEVSFILRQRIEQLTVGFHLDDSKGIRAFGTNSLQLGEELRNLTVGKKTTIQFKIPLNIGVGKYSLAISLHEGESHATNCYFWGEGLYSFEVERIGVPKFVGAAYLPVEISVG
ncbi:MAG: ABC transporter ATP-binding protein [Leptospira sp.]|nr:ABC transporter ATP-binding protein [Leptospira sp.]